MLSKCCIIHSCFLKILFWTSLNHHTCHVLSNPSVTFFDDIYDTNVCVTVFLVLCLVHLVDLNGWCWLVGTSFLLSRLCPLRHLDNHSLWEGKTFAVRCFKIIMYSIQVSVYISVDERCFEQWVCACNYGVTISFCSCPVLLQSQHSHLVIQQLLGHLDANSKNSATVRAGIVEVLLEAAAIAASGSVGKMGRSHHLLVCQLLSTARRRHWVWMWRWVLLIITHCLNLQVPQCWRCSTPCCASSASASTMSWPVAMTVVPTLAPRSSKLTRRGSCRRPSLGPLVS